MAYRLVLQLDDRSLHIPLAEGDLTLGSAEGCDVHIPHDTVSDRHARLQVTSDGVVLTDLGSSNGTLVNGWRIGGRVALAPGRPLAFGAVEGTFERIGFERIGANEVEPVVRVGSGRVRRPPAPSPPDPPSLVPAVRRLYEDAARVAPGDVSVLICGESGTGKELLVRFVHAASGRPDSAFVVLNCAALPRDLLEAELFGVEEGAATGVSARPGKFELADGGTLFLDEIGDMALATQAKILRALQEGEVHRLGGRSPHPARARVISATNRNVDALLTAEGLRRDLYHRIADWRIELPPLRERRADIPNLAAHFLDREVRRRNLRSVGISRAAMDVLGACDWPGNIRQLEREMARIALFLDDGELVEPRHLQESLRRSATAAPAPSTLKEAVEEAERREILRALDLSQGDTRRAAERLGIGRSTLYRKIAGLGIDGAAGRMEPAR